MTNDEVLSYSVRAMAEALVERVNRRIANGRATKEDKALLDAVIPFIENAEGPSGPDNEERVNWEGARGLPLFPEPWEEGAGVFRDPALRGEVWRVLWNGEVLTPYFNSRGAADAYFAGLRSGARRPEYP